MKVLITGATGFVGRNLLPRLLSASEVSCELALLNFDQENALQMYQGYQNIRQIDLLQPEYPQHIIDFNPDIVLHMASFLTSRDDEEILDRLIQANILFGTRLLHTLQNTSFRYFINIGTFAEYLKNDGVFDSAYLYAATKTAFRSIIHYYQQKTGFQWINVIPYTIYGGQDSQKKVIDYILSSLDAEEDIKMSPGEQQLDFIHVFDVADFFIRLFEKIESIKMEYIQFELGTGVGTTIRDLARIIEAVYQKNAHIQWGGLPYRARDVMRAIANTANLTDILNWTPGISLQQGIRMIKDQS